MGREDSLGVLGGAKELSDDVLPVDDCSVRRDGGPDQNLDETEVRAELLPPVLFKFGTIEGTPPSGERETGAMVTRGSPRLDSAGNPKPDGGSERKPSRNPESRRPW